MSSETVAFIKPILAVAAGLLILFQPRTLVVVVSVYLLAVGLAGLIPYVRR